jgi:hypothetical protein
MFKSQIPMKSQLLMTKFARRAADDLLPSTSHWNLGFGISLGFGIWTLVIPGGDLKIGHFPAGFEIWSFPPHGPSNCEATLMNRVRVSYNAASNSPFSSSVRLFFVFSSRIESVSS